MRGMEHRVPCCSAILREGARMKVDGHNDERRAVLTALLGLDVCQMVALLLIAVLLGAVFSAYVYHRVFIKNAEIGWEEPPLCSSVSR
jgi:hypothetical protein